MAIEKIALARQDAADLMPGEAADRPDGLTRRVFGILIGTGALGTAAGWGVFSAAGGTEEIPTSFGTVRIAAAERQARMAGAAVGAGGHAAGSHAVTGAAQPFNHTWGEHLAVQLDVRNTSEHNVLFAPGQLRLVITRTTTVTNRAAEVSKILLTPGSHRSLWISSWFRAVRPASQPSSQTRGAAVLRWYWPSRGYPFDPAPWRTTMAEQLPPEILARSDLLRLGAAAGLGFAALPLVQPSAPRQRVAHTPVPLALAPLPGVLDLYINEGYLKLVDDTLVYHRGFGSRPTDIDDPNPSLTTDPTVITATGEVVPSRSYPLGAHVPPRGTPAPLGPDPANPGQYFIRRNYWASIFPQRTIVAELGGTVRLRVQNRLGKPHVLTVYGAGPDGGDLTTGDIGPDSVALLEFPCPEPGTYIFADPTNAPVERVLGLFGVLVVMDPEHQWDIAADLATFERQWVWICHCVESRWASMEAAGQTVDPARNRAEPRYFTLNGRSGFEALGITFDDAVNLATEEETLISGYPRQLDVRQFGEGTEAGTLRGGQLVRLINPGICLHQMHFHGNHIWTVRRNNVDWPRHEGFVDVDGHVVLQQWEDVVELEQMDTKDCILPIKRPPDAIDPVWFARTGDWVYPMHCHAEPSQTAAGGMYPGGLVAHWTLKGPNPGATQ